MLQQAFPTGSLRKSQESTRMHCPQVVQVLSSRGKTEQMPPNLARFQTEKAVKRQLRDAVFHLIKFVPATQRTA